MCYIFNDPRFQDEPNPLHPANPCSKKASRERITMTWQKRGNRRYYYRKRRQGDRVISEYVGAGQLAETEAALDNLERQIRRAQRRRRQEHRALDAQVNQICDLIRILTDSVLLINDYHTHKGQWRKKRND